MKITAMPVSCCIPFDQVEDLGLYGDIQGSCGLIGNQNVGFTQKGHGDHDPLPHAAGYLVHIFIQPHPGFRDADLPEHFDRFFPGLRFRSYRDNGAEKPPELFADPVHGIERRHGFLKYHGDPIAPDPVHLVGGKLQDIIPPETESGRFR